MDIFFPSSFEMLKIFVFNPMFECVTSFCISNIIIYTIPNICSQKGKTIFPVFIPSYRNSEVQVLKQNLIQLLPILKFQLTATLAFVMIEIGMGVEWRFLLATPGTKISLM